MMKKLRNALAVSHARKLFSTLRQEAESTVSHNQANRITYMTELFSRIHRVMFHYWKEQVTSDYRPGNMTNTEKRREFRSAIESLILDGDNNLDTAIFDNNGFVIHTANIAERLALFYQKIRSIRPFMYGNQLTLDFFMASLGILPAFKGVYECGIDFRRIEMIDAVALHNPKSSCEELTVAFQHAMDTSRSKSLENKPNGYGKWPENRKSVFGIPFLSHRTENGIDCLVTVNGGLVPLDSINEELMISGTQFADYPLNISENIIGYLPGTEELRVPGKRDIDGIDIAENGAAPLFCLDVNMLTGLRFPSHTELTELIKQFDGEKASIFNLAYNEKLKGKLLVAANGDARLERTIEIAYERLNKISRKLDNSKRTIFEGKTPDAYPKLFMCMGGTGSGKTAVDEMAGAQCGENYVIASLDEFRKESDLYKVLTAANHHSDDYIYVEPFANRLRELVANYAIEKQINVLYDGTGIPYMPRYSRIVETFKHFGFITQMLAVDAFIIKPEGREELSRSAVIDSVKDRFEKSGRALPWVITVEKHIRAPASFLDALEHQALGKISLFANDGARDRHYLVAESYSISDHEARALQEHQNSGTLAEYLKSMIRNRDDSVLKNIVRGEAAEIDKLINRNPAFVERNVAYQVYSSKGGNRVLAVYNAQRMVDFVEKGQLNPNASGQEGLLHKRGSLAFFVDPYTKEPWKIKLQSISST